MAEKTIAVKIDVQDSGKISKLEQDLVKLNKRKSELNKLVREGIPLTDREAKELGELGTNAQATRNKLNDLKNEVLKNNDALKKNSGFVAGVKQGVGQWATSMIGVTAGIALVSKGLTDAVQRIKTFDESIKNLSAITGATGKDLEFLKQQAIELGSKTTLSASQVAEGFKLIASAKPELLKNGEALSSVTEEAIRLAEAAGLELPEAASALANTLNQFGAGADQAAKFVDVLAAGSKEGAGDVNFLNEAFVKAGVVASQANLSVQETAASFEVLAEKGFTAENAGTQFRNILIKLQSGADDTNPAVVGLSKAIENLGKKNLSTAELAKEFGTQNLAAAQTLLTEQERLSELTTALDKNGVALEQQKKNNDTLEGSLKMLDSAYEGLILSIEDGSGVISQSFKSMIDDFSRLLNMISALNSDDPLKALSDGAISYANKLGVVNDEQANFSKNLIDNSYMMDLLKEKFVNGEITIEQYKEAVKRVGEGWKRAGEEIAQTQITPEAIESTELTNEEKEALKKRGEKRAIEEQKARIKILEEEEKKYLEGLGDEDPMTGLKGLFTDEEKIKIEEDYQYLKDLRQQEFEQELADEEAQARAIQEIEKLKSDARRASVSLMADFINVGATLAEEGSQQQKFLASALTLVQTYQAAQAAYLSQLAIPTPSAPFRAAAAAGIAIASGLANVAKINAVKFADGGLLVGDSHANGGIPFTVNGQSGFEAEGGEAIINKRSTAMFRPLLSAINEAGGGKRFFADGGLTPVMSGVNSSVSSTGAMLDMDSFARTIVDGINDKKVINVATETASVVGDVQNTTQDSKF